MLDYIYFNMRIKTLILIALSILLATCEDYHGNIFGRVVQKQSTGGIIVPVAGALVTAKNLKDQETVSTLTDINGYYRLLDAGFGLNEVKVEKEGYYSASSYLDVRKDQNYQLDFVIKRRSDTKYTGLVVFVFDRIYHEEKPVSGARVDLYRGFGTEYYYLYTETTNEDGAAIFAYPADKVQDNMDFNTSISLKEKKYPIAVNEDVILLYRLEVSANGYRNTTKDFKITYYDSIPKIVFVLLDPLNP